MLRTLTLLTMSVALPAQADAPKVVTDIAPVHSLTSMVMEGVGTPDLILKPGLNPHAYAMRPSEAAALERADLVVWIGPSLTPWLEGPVETIGANATSLALFDHAPVKIEIGEEDGHDHDDHAGHDDHDDHDDHDHAKHDDHDHDDHADHDDHDDHDHTKHDDHDDHDEDHAEAGHEGHEGHDHHDHGGVDPHAWLDPVNAIHWLDEIAEHLSEVDPDNAAAYADNAARAKAELEALTGQIAVALAPMKDKNYAIDHEAYAYFEARFGLEHSFAITDSHDKEPGPARIAELQAKMAKEQISCILTDSPTTPDLLNTVIEGQQAKVLTADPIGAEIPLGPLHYKGIISGLSLAFVEC